MFDIQEELKKLPGKPGVYIMHDAKDTIIYVGKAISLKNRVRQYFQSSRNLGSIPTKDFLQKHWNMKSFWTPEASRRISP